MHVGPRIRELRLLKNWSLRKLSVLSGLDAGFLSRLEREESNYSPETLIGIANALSVTVASLHSSGNGPEITLIGNNKVPLLSADDSYAVLSTAKQKSLLAGGQFLVTDREYSRKAFGRAVVDDSMTPQFDKGDIYIIEPQVKPAPGDLVEASMPDGSVVFRLYKIRGLNAGGDLVVELEPLNHVHPLIRSDRVNFTIAGTMVEHRRYRK